MLLSCGATLDAEDAFDVFRCIFRGGHRRVACFFARAACSNSFAATVVRLPGVARRLAVALPAPVGTEFGRQFGTVSAPAKDFPPDNVFVVDLSTQGRFPSGSRESLADRGSFGFGSDARNPWPADPGAITVAPARAKLDFIQQLPYFIFQT